MARRRRKTTTEKIGRATLAAATLPKRVDRGLQPVALAIGWAGMAALAALGVLAARPGDDWPLGMERDRLAVYLTVALVAASLLGWTFMQEGQAGIERRVGRTAAMWLFVILPIAAAAIVLVDEHVLFTTETQVRLSPLFLAARWYSPAAVVASVAAFLARKSSRPAHLTAHALLLVPFAALVAALVFGFRVPWVDASLRETLRSLGASALALQLVLAWFVGGTG